MERNPMARHHPEHPVPEMGLPRALMQGEISFPHGGTARNLRASGRARTMREGATGSLLQDPTTTRDWLLKMAGDRVNAHDQETR